MKQIIFLSPLIFLFLLTMQPTGSAQEKGKDHPIIVLETNQGLIEIELLPEVAPKACENMLGLINNHYYDGIVFHRVIQNFMIQSGDPTATGRGGQSLWGQPFADEVSPTVTFDRTGILAMANSGPSTNGSQFFITTQPTPWLNMKHTIFGKVIAGMDTVQKIEKTPVDGQDRPIEKQTILKAYMKKP